MADRGTNAWYQPDDDEDLPHDFYQCSWCLDIRHEDDIIDVDDVLFCTKCCYCAECGLEVVQGNYDEDLVMYQGELLCTKCRDEWALEQYNDMIIREDK